MNKFHGTGVALVTPFNADGSVDFKGLENLINHIINGGVDYLVSLGTTGETATLNAEEKKAIWQFTAEVNQGRVPLVAGIGGNSTREVTEHLKHFEHDGYNAILSVSPYYNKPTQEGFFLHYKAVAEQVGIPLCVYNIPGRTGKNIEPETIARMAELPNLTLVKEASRSLLSPA